MNYIIGEDRTQIKIESIDSYVNENNEVRVIDKIVDVMDIESLGFNIGKNDTVGRPKFNPRDILKLYIYGYFNGIRSSRKLAKQCAINKEVIWLVKGLAPKYRVIADFRKDNSDAFEAVFKSFVNYCIELDLYGKELIAVDGTKLEASASKRKHYSKNKLAKMKELAQSKILEYLHDIDINDNDDEITSKDIDKDKIVDYIKRLEEKVAYYDDLENILLKMILMKLILQTLTQKL